MLSLLYITHGFNVSIAVIYFFNRYLSNNLINVVPDTAFHGLTALQTLYV